MTENKTFYYQLTGTVPVSASDSEVGKMVTSHDLVTTFVLSLKCKKVVTKSWLVTTFSTSTLELLIRMFSKITTWITIQFRLFANFLLQQKIRLEISGGVLTAILNLWRH